MEGTKKAVGRVRVACCLFAEGICKSRRPAERGGKQGRFKSHRRRLDKGSSGEGDVIAGALRAIRELFTFLFLQMENKNPPCPLFQRGLKTEIATLPTVTRNDI